MTSTDQQTSSTSPFSETQGNVIEAATTATGGNINNSSSNIDDSNKRKRFLKQKHITRYNNMYMYDGDRQMVLGLNGVNMTFGSFLNSLRERKNLHRKEIGKGAREQLTSANQGKYSNVEEATGPRDKGIQNRMKYSKRKSFPDRSPAMSVDDTQLPNSSPFVNVIY